MPDDRRRWLKRAELTIGAIMTIYGLAGMIASSPWLELIGKDEPPIVMHLSWAALFFAGLVGLIAAADD